MSEDPPPIPTALRMQAHACRRLGSPLNGALLDRAAEDWLAGGPVKPLLAPWAHCGVRALFDAAASLRLIGAWHELALCGDDPAMAQAYAALDEAAIWTAARHAMVADRARMAAFMAHEPQTNEVRRAICLVGGFLEIAKVTGLPLRCFEIAASAGLNVSWDRYRYRMGEAAWGDPAASVSMDTDWQGPPPTAEIPIKVIERAACDRRPTDLTDPAQRRRLLAYVWADQPERLARIRAAIDVTLAQGVTVEAADAVDWTRARVAPVAGAATVLYHSVFWQYMPAQSQTALAQLIVDIGSSATRDAPFAWLRMEPDPQNMLEMQVRLTLWPTGTEQVLATVHPHGAMVNWTAT